METFIILASCVLVSGGITALVALCKIRDTLENAAGRICYLEDALTLVEIKESGLRTELADAKASAESLSCMVEQLKGEAGNRIVEAARLREEIVILRRDGIAKDERIRELEQKLHDLTFEPNGDDSDTMETVHAVELAQIRQQVEAEVRLYEFLLIQRHRPADATYWDMHHEAELRRRIPAKGETNG